VEPDDEADVDAVNEGGCCCCCAADNDDGAIADSAEAEVDDDEDVGTSRVIEYIKSYSAAVLSNVSLIVNDRLSLR